MSEGTWCPLSLGNVRETVDPCMKSTCAWWLGDCCAVAALGKWAKDRNIEKHWSSRPAYIEGET